MSSEYNTPISVAGNGKRMNISALAVKYGMLDSTVVTASYAIDYPKVATPNFNPAGGTYLIDRTVTITCATPGATIYYTTNGSIPTDSSTVYSTPISVAGNGMSMTISALAVMNGMLDSSVAAASYTISYVHGSALWATPMTSASGYSRFNGVAVDTSGNTYAVGYIYGTGSFDFGGSSSAFIDNGANSPFYPVSNSVIVKYNSSGTAQWATPIISACSENRFMGVAVDIFDKVYAAGWINGNGAYDFGWNSSTFNGVYNSYNTVIVKYHQ